MTRLSIFASIVHIYVTCLLRLSLICICHLLKIGINHILLYQIMNTLRLKRRYTISSYLQFRSTFKYILDVYSYVYQSNRLDVQTFIFCQKVVTVLFHIQRKKYVFHNGFHFFFKVYLLNVFYFNLFYYI